MADPGLQLAIDLGKVRVFANFFDAIALQFMNTGWFTTTDYVAHNRDTVIRFARAMRDATVFVGSHPDDTVDVLAKFTGVDPSVVLKTKRMSYAPSLAPQFIQPVIDACAHYKTIPATFDARDLIVTGLT